MVRDDLCSLRAKFMETKYNVQNYETPIFGNAVHVSKQNNDETKYFAYIDLMNIIFMMDEQMFWWVGWKCVFCLDRYQAMLHIFSTFHNLYANRFVTTSKTRYPVDNIVRFAYNV